LHIGNSMLQLEQCSYEELETMWNAMTPQQQQSVSNVPFCLTGAWKCHSLSILSKSKAMSRDCFVQRNKDGDLCSFSIASLGSNSSLGYTYCVYISPLCNKEVMLAHLDCHLKVCKQKDLTVWMSEAHYTDSLIQYNLPFYKGCVCLVVERPLFE